MANAIYIPHGARETQLIPVKELSPGAIGAIRRQAIDKVVTIAAGELGKPPQDMVVRDIRPYSDLAWCSTTNAVTAALTTDTWIATSDDSLVYGSFIGCVTAASTTMADNRWVGIYGLKDMRVCLATVIEPAISFVKLNVGGNDRVIWDVFSMYAYPDAMAAVCPSVVVIPQNTDYQIYLYGGLSDDGASTDVAQYIVLEGFVVEPKGKVLSP